MEGEATDTGTSAYPIACPGKSGTLVPLFHQVIGTPPQLAYSPRIPLAESEGHDE